MLIKRSKRPGKVNSKPYNFSSAKVMFGHRDKTPRNERQSRDSKVHWPRDSTSELRSGTASRPSFFHLEVLDSYLDNAQIHGLKSNRPQEAEKSTKRVKFDESSFQTNMVRICSYRQSWPMTVHFCSSTLNRSGSASIKIKKSDSCFIQRVYIIHFMWWNWIWRFRKFWISCE